MSDCNFSIAIVHVKVKKAAFYDKAGHIAIGCKSDIITGKNKSKEDLA